MRVDLEAAQLEVETLKAAVVSYETGTTWQTTCLEHAHNLDWAYARHLELEHERNQSRASEAELYAKVEQLESDYAELLANRDAFEDMTMRREAVVEAARAVNDSWFGCDSEKKFEGWRTMNIALAALDAAESSKDA